MNAIPYWHCRPQARQWRCAPASPAAAPFHASLPGYLPTRLAEAPRLARELGVGRLFVKDESDRLSLGAFKVLGASWAAARALTGLESPQMDDLRKAARSSGAELVTATDGNHGRAVAYLGRMLGLPVRVYVPAEMSAVTQELIAREGASVATEADSYDGSVELAADYAAAADNRVLIQDTAWPGYDEIPGWIVEGYETLLHEVDEQLAALDVGGPDLVSVPIGVGSFAQAVVTHYRSGAAGRPAVLAAEPTQAACLLASLHGGRMEQITPGKTVMAGLSCGRISSLAWPVLAAGLDAAIAVPDEAATRAVAELAEAGVRAGSSGAAALAGVRAALTGEGAGRRRTALGVRSSSVIVLLSTEGQDFQP